MCPAIIITTRDIIIIVVTVMRVTRRVCYITKRPTACCYFTRSIVRFFFIYSTNRL